jgi:hypothetical protein
MRRIRFSLIILVGLFAVTLMFGEASRAALAQPALAFTDTPTSTITLTLTTTSTPTVTNTPTSTGSITVTPTGTPTQDQTGTPTPGLSPTPPQPTPCCLPVTGVNDAIFGDVAGSTIILIGLALFAVGLVSGVIRRRSV